MATRGRGLALLLLTGLVAAGCGGDGYEYVQNDGAGLYFRVPESWNVVEIEQVDDGMPEAVNEPADGWVRLLDRSTDPDIANFEAPVPTEPVGLASVVPLPDLDTRDQLDYAALRALALGGEQDPLALASQSDGGVEIVSLEDVTTGDGLRGERIVFTVEQDDGGFVTMDQTALVDPQTTEIYRLLLKCEARCYEDNRDEIDGIVDSWTIDQER